jgi:hypothetical protein
VSNYPGCPRSINEIKKAGCFQLKIKLTISNPLCNSSSSRLMQLHKLKVDITKEIGVTYRHTKVTVQRITKNGMTTDTDRKIYPVSIQKRINLYCRTLQDTILVPASLLHFD